MMEEFSGSYIAVEAPLNYSALLYEFHIEIIQYRTIIRDVTQV